MNYIYLDHAATTPPDEEVLQAMQPYYGKEFANPSSMHEAGRKAKFAIESARREIAEHLHCNPEEIFFTGSGTEANNLAIMGIARANKKFGNHILVSSVEHKSVLESARRLSEEGFVVEYIPVDSYGMIDVAWVLDHITERTILISVMYANNEIGTIQPITAMSALVQEKRGRALFPIIHTDACQGAEYYSLDTLRLGVDMLTFNGAKMYGPKGVGVLFKKKAIPLQAVIVGGGQESGMRSGTENVPAIMGLAYALTKSERSRSSETERLIALRKYVITSLQETFPDIVLNGHPVRRLPNNVHVSIPYVEGESMVLMLDHAGIAVSTGSACSSNDLQVSHVLVAIGQDEALRHGSLRITLGRSTTQKDCDYFLQELTKCVSTLRSFSPLTLSL